jgi:alpha-methylacyl-CoA racemase
VFATRTRDDWAARFGGTDACVAPVLSALEAPGHPHNQARRTFVTVAGRRQPAPAPRFGRTPPDLPAPAPHPGQHTDEILSDAGLSPREIARLRASGAVA